MWLWRSSSAAVFRTSPRTSSQSVHSSASGNWMPWFCHSGLPQTVRSRAHLTASSTQKAAAPRLDAAWRMRFSWTKRCASARPRSSSPRIASSPTRTSSSNTSAWSVGMLSVHQKNSTVSPGASRGTMKAVIPRASPGEPDVRAKTRSWLGRCMPELKRFLPLVTPFSPSRRAGASLCLASAPRGRLHVRGIGAGPGLGEAERETDRATQGSLHENLLLLGSSELVRQEDAREVADHRDLALGVVVKPDAEPVEVLADDRQHQVRAAPAPELLRQGIPPQAGSVGARHPPPKRPRPPRPRDPPRLEVSASVLASMVEEASVVAFSFQRADLGRDE